MDTGTTTVLMTFETGIFLVYFSFVFLLLICWLLYAVWPTDHSDF